MEYLGRVQHNTTYIQRHNVYGGNPVILLAASQVRQFLLQMNSIPSELNAVPHTHTHTHNFCVQFIDLFIMLQKLVQNCENNFKVNLFGIFGLTQKK
jgi:hypothetical protein